MDRMGGILTNGLGCGPARFMILGPFRLNCRIEPIDGGGGAGRPPGLWQRLKDIEDQQDDIIKDDCDDDLRKVTISVRIGNKWITQEYCIPKSRADKVVNVINMINGTIDKVTVRLRHSIMVKFLNGAKSKLQVIFKGEDD